MEQKDYLLREIEKIFQMISYLINKISGINSNNFSTELDKINEDLNSQFNFDLNKIIHLNKNDFFKEISPLNITILEKLLEFLTKTIFKFEEINTNNFDTKKLAQQTILLIEFIENKTKTFSLNRIELKNRLQQIADS